MKTTLRTTEPMPPDDQTSCHGIFKNDLATGMGRSQPTGRFLRIVAFRPDSRECKIDEKRGIVNDQEHKKERRKMGERKMNSSSSYFSGRVALGGCPPRAPTDPYVDALDTIRFLGSWFRCLDVRVDDPRRRKRITRQQPVESVPDPYHADGCGGQATSARRDGLHKGTPSTFACCR